MHLELEMASGWSGWKELLSEMPKPSPHITSFNDLIIALMQPDPKQRISSATALKVINKLTTKSFSFQQLFKG